MRFSVFCVIISAVILFIPVWVFGQDAVTVVEGVGEGGVESISAISGEVELKRLYFPVYTAYQERDWESVRLHAETFLRAVSVSEGIAADNEFVLGVKKMFAMSYLEVKEGGQEQAEKLYEEIVAIAPDESDSRITLAILKMELSRDGAVESAMRLADEFPGELSIQRAVGLHLQGEHRGADAEKYLKAALKLAPQDIMIATQLGSIYDQSGRYFELISLYEQL